MLHYSRLLRLIELYQKDYISDGTFILNFLKFNILEIKNELADLPLELELITFIFLKIENECNLVLINSEFAMNETQFKHFILNIIDFQLYDEINLEYEADLLRLDPVINVDFEFVKNKPY